MKNLLPNKILAWYDNNKRDLPWRRFKGFKDKSYKVLVSEFMLQQTQVKTVIPYFEKFIEKFTSLEKLSEANLTTVYRFWQGLGYYSRAKNLLRTSKIIQSKFNGKIPEDYNVLLTFPGIGDYTASAIMAIAFNKNFVGVDGNVERFIARLFGHKNNKKNFKKNILADLRKIYPKKNFSDFAQALMELGALICTPQNPKCIICPVHTTCVSFKKNSFDYKILNKKKINKKKYYLLYSSEKNKILFLNKEIRLLKDFVNLPLIEYKKDLFDSNFQKTKFSFEGKPKIFPKLFVHNISNMKMLIQIVIFKRIKQIKDKQYYWIYNSKIDNYLLSNFSNKFIKLINKKKIFYV